MLKKAVASSGFHIERSNDLASLGEILTRREIIRDAAPLLSAASNCRQITDEGLYGYKIPHLIFHKLPEGLMHHARPQGVNCVDFTIDVTVDLCGLVLDEAAEQDPFTALTVDILISGEAFIGEDVKTLKCAWHLDKHEEDEEPVKTEKQAKEGDKPHKPRKGRSFAIHPLYHFQHGGHRVWELADYGEQLLLEPPRIAHPPLDGVLAIDFVLSNYLGDEWKLLREQDEVYVRLVREAQGRCWRPYALATAALWRANPLSHVWPANDIWPQL